MAVTVPIASASAADSWSVKTNSGVIHQLVDALMVLSAGVGRHAVSRYLWIVEHGEFKVHDGWLAANGT
ncbi:MAG: hypothetical protein HYR62_04435 [Actinobacteria bacterium]|nr:hypothetical protein [Actinomycetota bacterium]MBI3686303.1 hypothetical protein [Actinomycetota bacterium]